MRYAALLKRGHKCGTTAFRRIGGARNADSLFKPSDLPPRLKSDTFADSIRKCELTFLNPRLPRAGSCPHASSVSFCASD
jgi:hypothetical protein